MEKIQAREIAQDRGYSDKEMAQAFRDVFGHDPSKRTRSQEIVWKELVEVFTLFPCMVWTPRGCDTHLAAIRSGKVEQAKFIHDQTLKALALVDQEPEVTKQKEQNEVDE